MLFLVLYPFTREQNIQHAFLDTPPHGLGHRPRNHNLSHRHPFDLVLPQSRISIPPIPQRRSDLLRRQHSRRRMLLLDLHDPLRPLRHSDSQLGQLSRLRRMRRRDILGKNRHRHDRRRMSQLRHQSPRSLRGLLRRARGRESGNH